MGSLKGKGKEKKKKGSILLSLFEILLPGIFSVELK